MKNKLFSHANFQDLYSFLTKITKKLPRINHWDKKLLKDHSWPSLSLLQSAPSSPGRLHLRKSGSFVTFSRFFLTVYISRIKGKFVTFCYNVPLILEAHFGKRRNNFFITCFFIFLLQIDRRTDLLFCCGRVSVSRQSAVQMPRAECLPESELEAHLRASHALLRNNIACFELFT